MSQTAKAKVFYGIRLDPVRFPGEVSVLLSKWRAAEEALSIYLLRRAKYDVTDEYGSSDELAEKTGIQVVSLDDDGVYLAIASTLVEQSWGVSAFDMQPLGMEEVLTLEQYAKWVGTDTKSGDWFIWAHFG